MFTFFVLSIADKLVMAFVSTEFLPHESDMGTEIIFGTFGIGAPRPPPTPFAKRYVRQGCLVDLNQNGKEWQPCGAGGRCLRQCGTMLWF